MARKKLTKNMTRGERVIAFTEKYCRVPEGKLVGKPMVLDKFQKRFILEVYDNPHGTTKGILSIARKNGKTGLIAAICLCHVLGPEAIRNSQVVSAARSRDQAALVFALMIKMIEFNPVLKARSHVVHSSKIIRGLSKNVEYKALSAEASTKHGLSPKVIIFDELGQVKGDTDAFVEALETAQGAYDDGLQLVISTQASTDADMLSVWIDDAIRSGDPHIITHVYSADLEKDKEGEKDDVDVLDPAAWKKANPALGTFRSLTELKRQAERASRMPSFETSFRNLYLNQRVNKNNPFVSARVWAQGRDTPEPLDKHPVYGGVDLSATTDLTAMVLLAQIGETFHAHSYFWMPEATIVEAGKRDKAAYPRWRDEGYIRTCPGPVIDYDYVAEDIGRITKDLNIIRLGFDPWRMDRLENAFQRKELNLPLEKYGQGYKSMSPALDALEEMLLKQTIRHGSNPVLNMCAGNATEVKDPAGNRKLDKVKSTGRIDGMIALAIAAGVQNMLNPNSISVDDWIKSFA